MNAIEITELVKTYESGLRAVDGLELTVPGKSIFGFLGLNGAGKTTTIRMIAGVSRPDRGTIRLFGEEVDRAHHAWKRQIGFVLDDPLYFEWMSPDEYLRFVGTMYGIESNVTAERTEELLEFFDLADKKEDPIGTFSTGMKKKISLAAAIIHNPRLIILDEPLDGIDALAASAIKETLRLMAESGTTIFITSHVLDIVEKLCTDIAIIHQGKAILSCRTDEIRSKLPGSLDGRAPGSLEDLFVELVSGRTRTKHLSWIR
jgi:ABC-2 type transport system ATP-binding protein